MAKTTLVAKAYRWFVGAFGNLSISPTLVAKLAAVPAGDVVAFGDKVEPNLKVVGVTMFSTALGASTTITAKIGDTVIINAEGTVTAVAKYIPVDDLLTAPDQEITLTVGGGAATGIVKLKLHYEVIGNL
ncbi:hypothetical protein E4630_16170 [Aeromonas hydrophila]|uniref:hypothetical protein n=1 Tax=Aeromonas hydrophila TaxID=644 RepID=UPI000FD182CC|nr:hypothetical protein [Aeromonas hydrophila]AZU47953.1 hypothetical protein C3B79_2182 [Aeromonas hydrophila]QBX71428.1 hypothetical protein E4625_11670 [Aeromonas hydrophila]QBX72257.1 hypothetical protein E4625_16395 [Aeromonas hydrophila]QBX76127.1 hypothetical protein E4630_11450 [Aeromonas hydrophila]QBX76957.1 hypothetical protein E4630_16170 [Aeromonas hydrophila]